MRLAQLMAGAREGGAEQFFERLCAALAEAGDEILPLIRRDPAREVRLAEAGLAPVILPFGGALDWRTRFRAARALRRFQPSVAVAWMGRAARHAPAGNWVLAGRLGGYYDLRRFRRCDHLIANTPALRDWVLAQNSFPAARVHVLPNFAPDLAGAPPAALPGVPPGARLALAMGRLHRNKGFDLLIGAVSRLPGLHAAIAGSGPEEEALLRLARHAGVADRVHFLGWRRDTASLLARADLLVCPSRQEVLGNVVLEAFSAGRPVVASMAEGPRALIETGRTGILVAQESAIALAAGMEAILQDPAAAARMAGAARLAYELTHAEAPVLAAWRAWLATIAKPAPPGQP